MNKFLKVILMSLLSYSLTNTTLASELVKAEAVPGGIEMIQLGAAEKEPVAYFKGNRVFVMKDEKNTWKALVGVPLNAKPQNYFLHVVYPNGKVVDKLFQVSPKPYPVEYLSGPDITSTEKPLSNNELKKSYTTWTDQTPKSLKLVLPVKGEIFGAFGLQRFYNQKPRQPHNGIDIAAPLSTPVMASAEGKVLETGHFDNIGNAVVIDHGHGLLTMYSHLNTVGVTKGQFVRAKEVIGTIGQGGIITRPHLHWSVILNGAFVNPELFLEAEQFNF